MYQMPKEKQNNFTTNPTYVVVPVGVRREVNGDIVRTNPEDNKRTFVGSGSLNKISPTFKVNSFKFKPNIKEHRGMSKNRNEMLNKLEKVDNFYSIKEDKKSSCVGSDKVPFDFGDLSYIDVGDWEDRECPTTEYDLTSPKEISVYYSEWSYYNGLPLKKLAVENYTHIYYAFAGIKGLMVNGNDGYAREIVNRDLYSLIMLDRFASIQSINDSNDSYSNPLKGNLAELVRIKKKFPEKKIILSIGGWTLSDSFPYIVNSKCARKQFLDNLKSFMRVFYFFDGIDIDYEFPLFDGSTKNLHSSLTDEPTNLVLFYSELRKTLIELEKELGKKLSLSTAVGVAKETLNQINIRYISEITDSINLMLYDFYGAWNNILGFNSNLYPVPFLDRTRSVDFVLNYLYRVGVNFKRVNIGVPSYGRGWENVKDLESIDDFKNQTYDASEARPLTAQTLGLDIKQNGSIPLSEIEKLKDRDDLIYDTDEEFGSGYVIHKDSGTFITFESEDSLQQKVDYLNNYFPEFKGIFYWEAMTDKNYTIVNKINKALGNKEK